MASRDIAAEYMALAEDELSAAYTASWVEEAAWPLYHVGRAQVYATLAQTAATQALSKALARPARGRDAAAEGQQP